MASKHWFGLSMLACVACCALPFVVGAAAGAIAAVRADVWICGGLLLVSALTWYVLKRRRMAQAGVTCCSTDCACKNG